MTWETYASRALLGHTLLHSTDRYAHLDMGLLVKATNKTAREIDQLLRGRFYCNQLCFV
jgi:hypothetical protein